jgi:hypothetical protein
MTRHLALSTVLAAALAAGSAYAADDMGRSAGAQGSVGQTAAASDAAPGATTAGQPSAESIRMMQQALQNEGYDVQVDGIWGPNTQQALSQFQDRNSSMAAAPATGMDSQQALTPGEPQPLPGEPQSAGELGWDRAGGIRNPDTGTDAELGTGRGETGVGGAGAGAGGGGGGTGQ